MRVWCLNCIVEMTKVLETNDAHNQWRLDGETITKDNIEEYRDTAVFSDKLEVSTVINNDIYTYECPQCKHKTQVSVPHEEKSSFIDKIKRKAIFWK